MAQPDILVPLAQHKECVCVEERRCAPKLSYFWPKRALIRAQITLRNFDTIREGQGGLLPVGDCLIGREACRASK